LGQDGSIYKIAEDSIRHGKVGPISVITITAARTVCDFQLSAPFCKPPGELDWRQWCGPAGELPYSHDGSRRGETSALFQGGWRYNLALSPGVIGYAATQALAFSARIACMGDEVTVSSVGCRALSPKAMRCSERQFSSSPDRLAVKVSFPNGIKLNWVQTESVGSVASGYRIRLHVQGADGSMTIDDGKTLSQNGATLDSASTNTDGLWGTFVKEIDSGRSRPLDSSILQASQLGLLANASYAAAKPVRSRENALPTTMRG
jgi:hypothetical protein